MQHRAIYLAAAVVAVAAASGRALASPGSPMYFEHLTLEDGLSQNTVLHTVQDSRGFVWLATENGLNRYDGTRVRRYFRDPESARALADDHIWDIAEDENGNLWIATNAGGLQQWLRKDDEFIGVDITIGADDRALHGNDRLGVGAVEISPAGNVWVGTLEYGVHAINISNTQPIRRGSFPTAIESIGKSIKEIEFVDDSRGLIGSETGLWLIDTQAHEVISHLHGLLPPTSRRESFVDLSVVLDGPDRVWVGSSRNGLQVFDLGAPGQPPALIRDYSAEIGHVPVQAVFRDSSNRIWIGTQRGLLLFDRATETFRAFRHDPADPKSLSSDYVLSISEDRTGLLWVGTRGGGVSRWNPRTWSLGAQAPDLLAGAVVNAFAQTQDQQAWIGTIAAGLVLFDIPSGAYTRFAASTGFADLPDQRIMSLQIGLDDDLWIGTWAGGLYRYRFADGRLASFRHDPADPDSLGANGIMSLHASPDGVIWAGTFGGGMARIDPATNATRRYAFVESDPDTIPSSRVTSFEDADSQGNGLWVGTLRGGLAFLDRRSGKVHRLEDDPMGIGRSTVYALHRDAQNQLWIGTAGRGLVRLRGWPDAPQYDAWSTSRGFSSNVIYGIQPDGAGQLWLSSNDGLMRFDPVTETVEVFHRTHGLHSDEFNFNAHARGPDGRLYFGGSGGYNTFMPLQVQRNSTAPKIALTGIELFNEPAVTPAPYPVLQSLDLDHADDVITFEFAALDFTSPSENQYSYRLEGFDRDWSTPSHRHRATYTNLDAGHYTFRVRASNGDGAWTGPDEELSIAVRVAPPPWGTWWAYSLYALLVGTLIYGFVRWRIRRAEAAARVRQLTFYDRPTGLPNRELFEQRLGLALRDSTAGRDELVVLCLRAHALREIGETLGYQVPDSVMTHLASRVSQCLSAERVAVGDTGLARISEEAFVILLQTDNATVTAMRIGRALNQTAADPVPTPTHAITVETTVGIATYYDSALLTDDLINFALLAAAEARQTGAGVAVYDNAMSDRARDRILLERELHDAIENDALELYVQPKYSGDDRLVGGEALLRWKHPTRGDIPPTEFVAIAEQGRLIGSLNAWVVRSACRIVAGWYQAGRLPVPLAVNVSAQEYVSGRIVDLVSKQTEAYCIDPSLIEVEITESVLMRDLESVERCLAELRERGHTVALDDFGTGYSSLKYLQRLPIDKIKIDRSFVSQTESHADQTAICSAIVALADSLGMLTVAEGVERAEHRDILLAMGCDEFQGYYYSEAVPASDFARWLRPAEGA